MLNLVLAVLSGKLWTHKESVVLLLFSCVQCKMRTELSHVHKYPLESDACFMSMRSAGPLLCVPWEKSNIMSEAVTSI